jgi:hypothetical protein
MLFSVFMLYDDEGYVLFTLKNFSENGRLYNSVYTQYGPLPYLLYAALDLAGAPLTHFTGRVVTLLAWSATALLCTRLVWRFTRNFVASLAVMVGVIVYLWVMVNEPAHPGGLVALMTAALACWGATSLLDGKDEQWGRGAGVLTACLLLTKVNVGVFALVATAGFILIFAQNKRLRAAGFMGLAVGIVVLPFLLMKSLLGSPWVLQYALTFSLAGGIAVAAARQETSMTIGLRPLAASVAGFGLLLVWSIGLILLTGTTLAGLLQGVLLGPLLHPAKFSLTFPWPTGAAALSLLSAAAFGFTCFGRWRGWRVSYFVAGARLLASGGVLYSIATFPQGSPDRSVLAYGLPCLWVFLWPLQTESSRENAARIWLGLVFLLQALHAFPVPGSQIAWGTFLALPLAACGGWGAVHFLRNEWPEARGMRLGLLGAGVLTLLVTAQAGWRLHVIGERYASSRPLLLKGAEELRLPDRSVSGYRALALNASAHADVLFSLPGMFSFNLWTGVPSPTLANVTHWFSLLDETKQMDIVHALESHPRAVVIIQKGHLRFLEQRNLQPTGPLYSYVMREFVPAFEVDGFQFCVHKGRKILPLLTAEVFAQKGEALSSSAAGADTMLKINLMLRPDVAIGSIELAEADRPERGAQVLCGPNSLVYATPLNLEGEATAPSALASLPLIAEGAVSLSVYFKRGGVRFSAPGSLVIVKDKQGREIAIARIIL